MTARRGLAAGPRPQASLLVPAHHASEQLRVNVPRLLAFLREEFGRSFEVILIPNPIGGDRETLEAARRLSHSHPEVRTCMTALEPGKGSALKEGFRMARGRWILTVDADAPFDLGFFHDAAGMLRLGYHLVLGNRRLPQSRFRMSKRVLGKVYPRFLLGQVFNLMVRALFPIHTTDTQAGIRAMTRECAEQAFLRQVCPHFSYDIEMILAAEQLGFRVVELPVTLELKSEKSTIRILRTGWGTLYWLSRIAWRHWKGVYGRPLPE
jgi:glycosyltransferase involved in cell wall biosynthesis